VETDNQKQKKVQWLKDRPMESYFITNKVISWKVDQEETMWVAPTLPKEDMQFNIKHDNTSVLLKNIGVALIAAKRSIDSINQMETR
jgi:hypothetical protein